MAISAFAEAVRQGHGRTGAIALLPFNDPKESVMFRVVSLIACLISPAAVFAASSCEEVRELADTVMFTRQYMPVEMQSQMIAVGSPERVLIAQQLIQEAYGWPKVPSTQWNAAADQFAELAELECRKSGRDQ
ncbi:hypothetical protein [Leisingera caerulea]|uniref:hypothetical protein n=1 Tax=Leisingera caerulea TaxID=506591 RepID=UPI0012B5FA0E|nr:hypothetical protein [Leisingera caerulea]